MPPQLTQDKKDLVQILTYTNSSRIFFSDDVILVEGDSDEYFFSFFYENCIKKRIITDRSIEILNIGGKKNYSRWKEFLESFKINPYFIGDFDNIKDHQILSENEFNQIKQDTKADLISKINKDRICEKTKDGKKLLEVIEEVVRCEFEITEEHKKSLTSLWNYLLEKQGLGGYQILEFLQEEKNCYLRNKIIAGIETKYSNNIFILKNGDLEDYLNIPKSKKGLESVIDFCLDSESFEKWCSANNAKFNEIFGIFEKILK